MFKLFSRAATKNNEYDNIAEGYHQKFVRELRETKGEAFAIQFICDNMESTLCFEDVDITRNYLW